jgi:hypothetical protein
MTSGDDWLNETNVVKEEGDNESLLVDVESHDELPLMKQEAEETFINQVAIKQKCQLVNGTCYVI